MEIAVLLWSVPLFIIASGLSMNTRGIAINNTQAITQLEEGIGGIQQGLTPRACTPTKSCKYAGGHCVRYYDQCNGKVDYRGCKGGKSCKCCIPVCENKDNPGSVCLNRQPYWGDCPPSMHFAQGSCPNPDRNICCKRNILCGTENPFGQCYRTDTSTKGCPLPLFPQLDNRLPCPKYGMSCCNYIPDQSCNCNHWGYKALCGERGWTKFCPDFCAGKRQSPINLFPQNLTIISGHELIYTNYDVRPDSLTCENNGHYAKCLWNSVLVPTISGGDLLVPTISGGDLTGTYIFDSMHWHIGCEDGFGSDHIVDEKSYSAELHMVHYKDTYANFSMALNSGDKDAFAVLGIFIHVNNTNNTVYDAITENLVYIKNGDEPPVTFTYSHTLSEFLPASYRDCYFYRYYGSFTHPSCNEVVVWTVFVDPSYMSKYQIQSFRCMTTGPFPGSPKPEGLPLCDNHRPIQSLNGREVTLWNLS